MNVILDASVAYKWVDKEEGSDIANALLGSATLFAPELLLLECGNTLWKKYRQRLFTEEEIQRKWDFLSAVPIDFISDRLLASAAATFSRSLSHPIYDCLYLALAQAKRFPLVTADARLVELAARVPEVEVKLLRDAV